MTYTATTTYHRGEEVSVSAPVPDAETALPLLRAALDELYPGWNMARVYSPSGVNVARLEPERFYR